MTKELLVVSSKAPIKKTLLLEIVVEVLDARKDQAWGAEGFSPYRWILERQTR
jgi:hypothetical protein